MVIKTEEDQIDNIMIKGMNLAYDTFQDACIDTLYSEYLTIKLDGMVDYSKIPAYNEAYTFGYRIGLMALMKVKLIAKNGVGVKRQKYKNIKTVTSVV